MVTDEPRSALAWWWESWWRRVSSEAHRWKAERTVV